MLNSDNDILYSYKREEDTLLQSLTSRGTKDSLKRHTTSTTMLHKDCSWIIETESNRTKYVIDNLKPSLDEIHFAKSYRKKEVDTDQLPDLFEEINQQEGVYSQSYTGVLTYKYRKFHVENCYGDSVSVEYPLISVEIHGGLDNLHYTSYGGPLSFSEFKKRFFSLLSEECALFSELNVGTIPLSDFNVTSVAFSGYSLGTLLHEAVGHLLEYDHAQSLGIKTGNVLTQDIDVYESPKDTSFGFYPCSDEGFESKKTMLLQNGIVQNFLGSFSVTGVPHCHGRAQHCTDLPLPRNTSLKMKKGTERDKALFQDTYVLYVHKKIKPV